MFDRVDLDRPVDQFNTLHLLWPAALLAAVCPMAFGRHSLLGGMIVTVIVSLLLLIAHRRRIGLATLALELLGSTGQLLLMLWFGSSLFFPVHEHTVRQSVEAFDRAPFSFGSWKQWEIPAGWLVDSRRDFDSTKPRRLLEQELAGEQNPFILKSAFRGGLIQPDDIIRLKDLDDKKNRLVYEYDPTSKAYDAMAKQGLFGNSILSVEQSDYVLRALVMSNRLTDTERELLRVRLLATFRDAVAGELRSLETALVATQLMELIQRTDGADREDHRVAVHRLLEEFQCLTSQRFGGRMGGFRSSKNLDHANDHATAAAVELMQHYGIPNGIDVLALRSYLRPQMHDAILRTSSNLQGVVHGSIRLRLESLPDIPPIRWYDYLQYELNLWAAILLVLLCCYVALSIPVRGQQG